MCSLFEVSHRSQEYVYSVVDGLSFSMREHEVYLKGFSGCIVPFVSKSLRKLLRDTKKRTKSNSLTVGASKLYSWGLPFFGMVPMLQVPCLHSSRYEMLISVESHSGARANRYWCELVIDDVFCFVCIEYHLYKLASLSFIKQPGIKVSGDAFWFIR